MTDPTSIDKIPLVLRLERLLAWALTVLLTVLFTIIFVLITTLVVMRYGFNTSIIGGNETAVILFIYTTAIGSSVEIAKGKHIRIDSLIGIFPARFRNWVEMLNLALIGILNVFLFYFSFEWISVVGNSSDPVLHIPEGIAETAIPIGCLLSVLFCVTRLVAMALPPAPATAE
jgi:TRAP-type C4-dicarboxylate transport system permease small subunit